MRAVVIVLRAEAYKDVASTRTRSGATAQQDAKRLPAATRLRAGFLDSVNHQAMTAEEMKTVVTSDGHEVHNIALRSVRTGQVEVDILKSQAEVGRSQSLESRYDLSPGGVATSATAEIRIVVVEK